MKTLPLPRLDTHPELRNYLLRYCRLKPGGVWREPTGSHRVGCLDATKKRDVQKLMGGEKATLAIQDPPYNVVAFEQQALRQYIRWSSRWVRQTADALDENAALYVWLGADQRDGFQPLPDFMVMMRNTEFKSRSLITMRNQRGYGTQKNWMAVR